MSLLSFESRFMSAFAAVLLTTLTACTPADGQLLAPVESVPTPTYAVAFVAEDDVLNVRIGPDPSSVAVGALSPTDSEIRLTGEAAVVDGQRWVGVIHQGATGWVNRSYLVDESVGCDAEAESLVEEFRAYLEQASDDPRLDRGVSPLGRLVFFPDRAVQFYAPDQQDSLRLPLSTTSLTEITWWQPYVQGAEEAYWPRWFSAIGAHLPTVLPTCDEPVGKVAWGGVRAHLPLQGEFVWHSQDIDEVTGNTFDGFVYVDRDEQDGTLKVAGLGTMFWTP